MGMFDSVYCKYPLPLPKDMMGLPPQVWAEQEFQTKDLECVLFKYTIEEDGSLVRDKDDSQFTFLRSGEDTKTFNGNFYFYTHILEDDLDSDYKIEFKAIYSFGKLKSIELIDFSKHKNELRKQRHKEFEEQRERKNRQRKSFKYKVYEWIYKKPLFFLFKKFYAVIEILYQKKYNYQRKIFFLD